MVFNGRGYMGQVTDRDIEMVNLLIADPDLSLDRLGARLGVSKQAVAERRKRLEDEGFTRSFYFWNVTPRFEGTKRVVFGVDGFVKRQAAILRVLDGFNPVVVFFRTAPEEFFQGRAVSLTETVSEVEGVFHFSSEEEEKQIRLALEDQGITKVSIEPVLFSRLLGEKCDLAVRTPEQAEKIVRNISEQLSLEASVMAILYEPLVQPSDQIDLLVIRDERYQPKTDSYERRVEQLLVDYHFMNLQAFSRSGDPWLKNMKAVFTRNESIQKKIKRILTISRAD